MSRSRHSTGKWPWRQRQFLYYGMTTLHLPLDRLSGHPIHSQIYDGLRRAILEARLSPGQRVPSTRALAEDLGVSRLPVLTAYDQLLHEGYLEGRTGSGTFVSAAIPDDLLTPPQPPDARAPARRSKRATHAALRPRDEGGLGPFRMSLPALDRFPHPMWARLVARRARMLRPADMAYGDPAGLVALRVAVAEHLRAARAVQCEVEQVLIVSGSQAAARLAATVLLRSGDRVAMEEPGSPLIRAALGAEGADIVPIPVDDEGVSVAALQRRGGRVRAAYVTPSHQYPLGTSMTAARRLALLDWAHREGAWLLEDDYDSEYRYVSRPLGALQGMDAHERVIYIGTFSKVLFPALRVGYVVVPSALRQRFVDARETFDLFSPTLYQLVLADFMSEGHFTRHLRRMRGVYRARRDALLTGLAKHCASGLSVINADAGLHLAVLLKDGLEDRGVVRSMAGRGLTATPLSSCYAGSGGRSGLLLGFGGSTEWRLLEATRLLGEILEESARD
jgi:GntR family transcriptional regulator/MocR family aminotransferase